MSTCSSGKTEEEDEDSVTSEVIDLTGRGKGNAAETNGEQLPNHKQVRETMYKNLLRVNDGK
jgi:hypothetical protein